LTAVRSLSNSGLRVRGGSRLFQLSDASDFQRGYD
jgi:hypothetical protein